jgi:hypothetical protein
MGLERHGKEFETTPSLPLELKVNGNFLIFGRRKRLVIDEDHIALDDLSLRLADIDTIGYSFTFVRAKGGSQSTLHFLARAGDKQIKFSNSLGGEDSGRDLFQLVRDLSGRTVEPRLAEAAIATVRAGGEFVVDSMRISKEGVTGRSPWWRKTLTLTWPEVVGTHLDDSQVFVDHIDEDGEKKAAVSVLRNKPNAPIIPAVIAAVAPEFA